MDKGKIKFNFLKHLTIDRDVSIAILLGMFSFIINSVITSTFGIEHFYLGNLFLYLSSLAFSPLVALITFIFSIPSILMSTSHYVHFLFYPIITTLFFIEIQISKKKNLSPQINILIFIISILVFNFIELILNNFNIEESYNILRFSILELFFILLAYLLSLNLDFWNLISNKPQLAKIETLLFYPIFYSIILIIVAISFDFDISKYTFVMFLFLFGMVTGFITASTLTKTISTNSKSLFTSPILGKKVKKTSFSTDGKNICFKLSTSEMPITLLGRKSSTSITAQTGICAIDTSGTVLFINKHFKNFLNVKNTSPIGCKISEIGITSEAETDILKLISKTTFEYPRMIEVKISQSPEQTFIYEVISQATQDLKDFSADSCTAGIILKVKDISNRRLLERQLINSVRLSAFNTLIKRITQGFNNTLLTIIGQACCGRWSQSLEETTNIFDQIIKNCKTTGNSIKQLFEFIEEKETNIQPVNMNLLLANHADLFNKIVDEHVLIEHKYAPETIYALTDSQLAVQVISNVILNSKEAIKESGLIKISINKEILEEEIADLIPGGRAGVFCRVTIEDNGSGMNSEQLSKCCNSFYTTKDPKTHKGLGLAIVYTIMRTLDGFLCIESQLDKGSSVSLYFPETSLNDITTFEDNTETKDIQIDTEVNSSILIVEDDLSVQQILQTILEKIGYSVKNCNNGKDALVLLAKESFDLIISSYDMNEMNGLELIKKIRENKPRQKALIMTAYKTSKELEESGIPIISKPFDLTTFNGKIRKIMLKN